MTRGLTSAVKPQARDFGGLFVNMNSSHADLINSLRTTERLTDKTADAMLQVDRRCFLDPDNLEVLQHAYQVHAQHLASSYSSTGCMFGIVMYMQSKFSCLGHIKQDHPVPIGYGETISAPHMHAEALKLLEGHCTQGASVLDVGSGKAHSQGPLILWSFSSCMAL